MEGKMRFLEGWSFLSASIPVFALLRLKIPDFPGGDSFLGLLQKEEEDSQRQHVQDEEIPEV